MVERKYGPCLSHEEEIKRHLHVVYARKTREKQVFMEELNQYRKLKCKQMLASITESVGPKWYQALSEPQRTALNKLKESIYQDLLEGRPQRTATIMRLLGLYPRPHPSELMSCIYLGREDPKEMLAQLYLATYGYPIEGKRMSYCLNARLMLSAILYLGLDNLICLLKKKFEPDAIIPKPVHPPKPKKRRPLRSPYLQKMTAVLYEPHIYRRKPPPPLPDLSDLNEPYEEVPVMPRPPPPPPPPPPPKMRLPKEYCYELANIQPLLPPVEQVTTFAVKKPPRPLRKPRGSSRLSLMDSPKKKKYGLDSQSKKKVTRARKPVAPTTGLCNAQYTINGVFLVHGKTLFVLGNICILPAQGELIHGGYTYVKGDYINIHCGFRGWPPEQKLKPCDCVKEWYDTVFQHVRENKCHCGHYFDYGHEANFSSEELPYFQKATRHSPIQFNYQTIFDLDAQSLHVQKEFKKVWETDSVLHSDDGTSKTKDDKKKKKKKSGKNLKTDDTDSIPGDEMAFKVFDSDKKKAACLGDKPKVEDYLKCALRYMRHLNIAARLPDLHLVPELKEWMRRRLYGSLTELAKKGLLRKSTTYWRLFSTLAQKGYGHVWPPKDPIFRGQTNWVHKHKLNKLFKQFIMRYKLAMFRSQASVTNLLWRTMYQAELPDKKFREIYFSYLFSQLEDFHVLHPYDMRESEIRKCLISKKRYLCLPAGVEAVAR